MAIMLPLLGILGFAGTNATVTTMNNLVMAAMQAAEILTEFPTAQKARRGNAKQRDAQGIASACGKQVYLQPR